MKAAPSRRDHLRAQLADLKMPGALEALDEILAGLDGGTLTAQAALDALLQAQIALRNHRRLDAAMRSSRLPAVKTLADFDFAFQPSIKREQLDSLHPLGFLERQENVVFLGPPGVGKTHLAISLAITAAESGRRVYYGTLGDLITSLEEASQAGRLLHRMKTLSFPSLLLVDEIGYLPISRTGAMLFFQLMSRRYEHASTVLTSNKGFEEWGEIFGDEVMAAALIDRLVHHCHIVNIRGNSYRMRHHTELHRTLGTARAADPQPGPGHARRRRTRPDGSPPTPAQRVQLWPVKVCNSIPVLTWAWERRGETTPVERPRPMPADSTAASGSAPTSSHFSNGSSDVTQFRVTTFAHCIGGSPGLKRRLAQAPFSPDASAVTTNSV